MVLSFRTGESNKESSPLLSQPACHSRPEFVGEVTINDHRFPPADCSLLTTACQLTAACQLLTANYHHHYPCIYHLSAQPPGSSK